MRTTHRRAELILFLITAAIAMGVGIVVGQRGSRDLSGSAVVLPCAYPEPLGQEEDVTGLAASLLGATSSTEC